MALNLSKYLNKTILVSTPALSGDAKCRPHKLIGIELIGLWLESDNLSGGFLTDEYRSHASVSWSFFVPFSQIACVAAATPRGPISTSQGKAPAPPAKPPAAPGSSSSASTTTGKNPKSK
jgi:hypothetical protein